MPRQYLIHAFQDVAKILLYQTNTLKSTDTYSVKEVVEIISFSYQYQVFPS